MGSTSHAPLQGQQTSPGVEPGPGAERSWQPLRLWRWPRNATERALAAILAVSFGGLGALFTALALSDHQTAGVLEDRGVNTTGTITAVSGTGKSAEPTLVFTTASGRRVRDTDADTGDLDVGDHVHVLYDPRDPDDHLVDTTARQDADGYLVDLAIAAPLLAIAPWQLARALHAHRHR